ncbi:MAG: hypothetical protein HUU60_08375 [Armatimonadetes bacterium]|nr:hypothetical protein [Armatimonadota bacterium]
MKRLRWLAAIACLALIQTSPGQLVELWRSVPDIRQIRHISWTTGVVDEEGNVTLGSGRALLVVRFDSQGHQEWYREINLGSTEALNSSALLSNGTIAFGGLYRAPGIWRSAAFVFTRQGDVVAHYNEPGGLGTGSIAGMHGDKIVLFGGSQTAVKTTLFNHQLIPIWSHIYRAPESPSDAGSGFVASDLIARNPVYASAVVFPRLICLDASGALLSAVSFDFGYQELWTDGSKLAIYGNGKVALGARVHHPLGQWQNILYGVDARTGIDWTHWFPPNGNLARLWTDPKGRLLGDWFDAFGRQYLLEFDTISGSVLMSMAVPLPGVRRYERYGLFAYDERGALYMVGVGQDGQDGQYLNHRPLIAKLDRNFRPVWYMYLDLPFATEPRWTRIQKDRLYLMTGATALPPLVKYKILAVRSEGDVSGDGCIDDKDLAMVLEAFGTANPSADLNGDGIVDDLDLEEVLHNFGLGCE